MYVQATPDSVADLAVPERKVIQEVEGRVAVQVIWAQRVIKERLVHLAGLAERESLVDRECLAYLVRTFVTLFTVSQKSSHL